MTGIEPNQDKDQDMLVESLLRLPSKNLRTRISELETEIRQRQSIRDTGLSTLGTHRCQLEAQTDRMKYAGPASHELRSRDRIKAEIARLEYQILSESVSCFRDVALLKERLQKAKEDLAQEELKLKLVGPDTVTDAPN